MKRSYISIIIFFAAYVLYAQQPQSPFGEIPKPYWWTLEQGKKMFREGNYGSALIAFEDARNARKAMYTKFEYDWIALLSIDEVRRMHDSLTRIETYISERGQFDAAAALDELYWRVKKDSLNNSALTVLSIFRRLKAYPEAEYWAGEVYRIEGENDIALDRYRAAVEYSANLEAPGFVVEIQYKIAELEKEQQHYNKMEEQLDEILDSDSLWRQDDASFVKTAMARTLENDGIDRFLAMYRYKNAISERAHRYLGSYYYLSGRHNKALDHLMFDFLINTTTIVDEVLEEQFDFKFTNLGDLMTQISRRKDLHEYMEKTDYYKTTYYFACALYATGKTKPARDLWTFLRSQDKADEWRGRAANQLRAPFVEKAVEMP